MRVLLLLLVGVLQGASHSSAGDAPFDKVPKDAEVHVVAVRAPHLQGVSEKEILDWHELALQLTADTQHAIQVRKCCSLRIGKDVADELQKMNAGLRSREGAQAGLTARFAMDLSFGISKPNFYDTTAFAGVKLPKAVQELVELGDKRTTFQTQRMNRDLLHVLFPKCIAPTPRDFQTARVTVKAGKPVVLVLTSYQQCQWVVEVEKGATVSGVFLFGSHAQAVKGTDAPVYYGALLSPDGKLSGHTHLNFFSEKAPEYESAKQFVKDKTGCDVASFQKATEAKAEPFVVKPVAK